MQYAKLTIIVCISLLSVQVWGQGSFSNWYFGRNAGVRFNGNSPVAVTGGQINTTEGCASISDKSGNLLFYTDGIKVWDKKHAVMPNGSGLTGHESSSQSALIVPVPGSGTTFYVFTVTDWLNSGDLRYSLVDMSLNGGNGDILPAAKNILLATKLTEKLVAANSADCGIWVITHQRDNNRFEARLVTSAGIANPVYSDAGTIQVNNPSPPNTTGSTGVMKVSKNNQKIGLATLARNIEVFDFNATTGQVSNPVALPMNAPKESYGVCFSPDNTKFYITEGASAMNTGYDIFQYNLSLGSQAAIINSRTLVGRAEGGAIVGDMQVAPDNKIYFTRPYRPYLGIIPSPNAAGTLCGFIQDGILLLPATSSSGLPNEIRESSNALLMDLGKDTILCPGNVFPLSAPDANSYLWSTGATTQTISVTASGKYWAMITKGSCTASDTINVSFSLPVVNLGKDTPICAGETLSLHAGVAINYLWSTGATQESITVSTAGQYWVKVFNGGCYASDTINVVINPLPDVNLGKDTILCKGQSLVVNAGVLRSYLWSTGATTPSITVTVAGVYWVKGFNQACAKSDSINVSFVEPPNVQLGNDTTLCQGQAVVLNAGTASGFLWSTGGTTPTIRVAQAGNYWVDVRYYNTCQQRYSIKVAYESCGCSLYVPNVFTPDANGSNDVFRPARLSGCTLVNFVVFNRWGQKVFASSDAGKGWDGRTNGSKQERGMYVWQITTLRDGLRKLSKGTVLLIR